MSEPIYKGLEFCARSYSCHTAWQLGIYFERDVRGGMAQHYGYPFGHAYIMMAAGHQTFAIGFHWGRKVEGRT